MELSKVLFKVLDEPLLASIGYDFSFLSLLWRRRNDGDVHPRLSDPEGVCEDIPCFRLRVVRGQRDEGNLAQGSATGISICRVLLVCDRERCRVDGYYSGSPLYRLRSSYSSSVRA